MTNADDSKGGFTRAQLEKILRKREACLNPTWVPPDPDVLFCNQTFDGFSCWPFTLAGHTATIQCPDLEITDESLNVARLCFDNGTWGQSPYENCLKREDTILIIPTFSQEKGTILEIGYSITTLLLLVSLIIFLYFKNLHCVRNYIHCNLIVSMLLRNLKLLILRFIEDHFLSLPKGLCKALVAIQVFFIIAVHFWMFVEGLYLFTLMSWTFSAHSIQLWHCLIIGWGCPLIICCIWALVRPQYESALCWLPEHKFSRIDLIYMATVVIILLANVVFIIVIVWMLMTKLRTSISLETMQYKKALKAIVVLVPLLGITDILFFSPPTMNITVRNAYAYSNTIIRSFEGLFVTFFYCFLNEEVQSAVCQKFRVLKEINSLSYITKSSHLITRRTSGSASPITNSVVQTVSDKKSSSSGSGQTKLSRTEPDTETVAARTYIMETEVW